MQAKSRRTKRTLKRGLGSVSSAGLVFAISLDTVSLKAQPRENQGAGAKRSAFNQEDRHVEGSKRQQGKQETEGRQKPAESHYICLQDGAKPGKAGQQPVREKKDLTLDSVQDRPRYHDGT
jgi:hypothetical protein